jgi:hypothetical protein
MKTVFESKTLWVNSLALVATGTGFFAGTLSSYPTTVCWLIMLQAVANLLLRLTTATPVTLSLRKP